MRKKLTKTGSRRESRTARLAKIMEKADRRYARTFKRLAK